MLPTIKSSPRGQVLRRFRVTGQISLGSQSETLTDYAFISRRSPSAGARRQGWCIGHKYLRCSEVPIKSNTKAKTERLGAAGVPHNWFTAAQNGQLCLSSFLIYIRSAIIFFKRAKCTVIRCPVVVSIWLLEFTFLHQFKMKWGKKPEPC